MLQPITDFVNEKPCFSKVDKLLKVLAATLSILKTQVDLSPSNSRVNNVLSDLVDFLTCTEFQHGESEFFVDEFSPYLTELPQLCALAECEMEKWWANKWLAEQTCMGSALREFWYTDHYRALVSAELNLLSSKSGGAFFLWVAERYH